MRWLWRGLVVLAALELALLVSGRGVLISERRVRSGERFIVPEWGNLGGGTQDALYCRYFTGRGVDANALWYSPNGFYGRRACPFVSDPI